MRLLLIPPNDLLRHPIPNRMFHVAKRLAKRHEIFLLSYTKHQLTGDTPRRSFNGFEVQLGNVIKVSSLLSRLLLLGLSHRTWLRFRSCHSWGAGR
jgi:pantoate kinase